MSLCYRHYRDAQDDLTNRYAPNPVPYERMGSLNMGAWGECEECHKYIMTTLDRIVTLLEQLQTLNNTRWK